MDSTRKYGSTETIPEIDPVSHNVSWSSGTAQEVIITVSFTGSAGVSASWFSGSIFESVVYAFGSYAPQSPIPYVESGGTITSTFLSGTIFDAIVFAFGTSSPGVGTVYGENGTHSVSFVNGTAVQLIFPTDWTETTTGTVSFFSGSIHQF